MHCVETILYKPWHHIVAQNNRCDEFLAVLSEGKAEERAGGREGVAGKVRKRHAVVEFDV